jgi:hypothetical protein
LRVLAFKLQTDPAKHYSSYYYVRNRTQYAGKPESFIRKAAANEYRAMAAYGLNMTPTLYLRCDDGKKIHLPYPEELDRMLKAGLAGPVPVRARLALEHQQAATSGILREDHSSVQGFRGGTRGERMA